MNYKTMNLEMLLLRRDFLLKEADELKKVNKRIKEELTKLKDKKYRNKNYDCSITKSLKLECRGENATALLKRLKDPNLPDEKRLQPKFIMEKVEVKSDLIKIALKNGIIKENEFYEAKESSRLLVSKIDLENEVSLL